MGINEQLVAVFEQNGYEVIDIVIERKRHNRREWVFIVKGEQKKERELKAVIGNSGV